MAKLIKQFFDLINPENNEKSSGVVIKLELESETKTIGPVHPIPLSA